MSFGVGPETCCDPTDSVSSGPCWLGDPAVFVSATFFLVGGPQGSSMVYGEPATALVALDFFFCRGVGVTVHVDPRTASVGSSLQPLGMAAAGAPLFDPIFCLYFFFAFFSFSLDIYSYPLPHFFLTFRSQ